MLLLALSSAATVSSLGLSALKALHLYKQYRTLGLSAGTAEPAVWRRHQDDHRALLDARDQLLAARGHVEQARRGVLSSIVPRELACVSVHLSMAHGLLRAVAETHPWLDLSGAERVEDVRDPMTALAQDGRPVPWLFLTLIPFGAPAYRWMSLQHPLAALSAAIDARVEYLDAAAARIAPSATPTRPLSERAPLPFAAVRSRLATAA